MRITEAQLRRIIRRELQLETAGLGLALADTMLPDEYKGLLDPRKPETFLLNPVTGVSRAMDPKIRAASKDLADELSMIPVIGAPFNVTSAIYEALDRDYDKAAVSLAAAIVETYISHGLGSWISASFAPVKIAGRTAMRTGVLQASMYTETVTTFLINKLQEIVDDALDHVAEKERNAGSPIPPAQLQQVRSALMSRVKPDMIKDQVVKQTADVMDGKVVGIPDEMEAVYIPPKG
jgi:hypothetical protein